MVKPGCPYGTHRVLEPRGVLPQGAWKLDNTMEIYDNEILVDVDVLNIDAASFVQLRRAASDDPDKIAAAMLEIVAGRGKHHNPVTGSGGMFIGRVAEIGAALLNRVEIRAGEKIASLVSLSLTPLQINSIKRIYLDKDQVEVEGRAILFASALYARLPEDLPERLALAVLDVAGAPARTARLVRPGDRVVVIGGGGKAGLLCLYEAKKRAGAAGRIIGIGSGSASCARMREVGLADTVLQVDARDPLAVLAAVEEATGGRLADLTINCVNRQGTEMASILATRNGKTVYFFSMATSFTAAALGAEGVGKDVQMLIGSGYTPGHARMALQALRECPPLRRLLEKLYA